MRVLITGALGQLGQELLGVFAEDNHHEIVAADVEPVIDAARTNGTVDHLTGVDLAAIDITDRDAVLAALTSRRPDVIVHPAAFTAVDLCESEVDAAYKVNVLGTRHLAEAARRIDAPVFYVSTDYVFDGTKASPYLEWDEPNPQSVYGLSLIHI